MRITRIARSADFERVLARRACCRSAHFAAHHLASPPLPLRHARTKNATNNLSTDAAPSCLQPVDESPLKGLWLGCVVPRRHARRAVTRNMIKRAIDSGVTSQASRLPAGIWVLRLRAPFDRQRYPSASSAPLRNTVADELRRLLEDCVATGDRARAGGQAG